MSSPSLRSLAGRLISMVLGGVLVAIVFVAARAGAQEAPAAGSAAVQPAAAQPQGSIADAVTAIQNVITYQGVLLDPLNTPKPSGSYQMTFRLYRDNSALVWQETQNVVVADGFFSVRLGSATALNPDLFAEQLYIGVQVAGDAEMTPRQAFSHVPYAMSAARLLQLRAYGVVESDGSKVNGFRFTSSLQNLGGITSYVIDIGETYNLNDYTTVVTPVLNNSCPSPSIPTTGSSSGRLLVDLFNTNGQRVYCKFHFMVLDLP